MWEAAQSRLWPSAEPEAAGSRVRFWGENSQCLQCPGNCSCYAGKCKCSVGGHGIASLLLLDMEKCPPEYSQRLTAGANTTRTHVHQMSKATAPDHVMSCHQPSSHEEAGPHAGGVHTAAPRRLKVSIREHMCSAAGFLHA